MLPYPFRLHTVAYRYDHFYDLRKPDIEPVKDLNDLLKISTDSYRRKPAPVKEPLSLTG
jgi:hypothetical protein